MAYEVLAQKWRPQNFGDVVGQQHVTTTLENQILSERVGHAYLFWGPRGTGKTTVARIFAKAVNCPNRIHETEFDKSPTAEPCNGCERCIDISQGKSFDVIETDAASNRGIDPIRELRENVKLAPANCTYKIYIIDEAHMLTTEAFNALLKTLEEPPPHVIFIMATTEHAKIPKTITSRCQDFDFRHLEDEKIIERLTLIAKAEEISADLDVLSLITRQSEGCLRDAENLLERLVSSAGKNVTVETVEQTLGLGSSFLLGELTKAIAERNLAEGLATLNKLVKQGTDLTQCLHQLIVYFRDLRLLAIDSNLVELIQSPKSDLPELKQKAEQMSVPRLSRIIKILMYTSRDIKQYGYAQLQLEGALIQLDSLEEGIQLQEIVGKLSALEQKLDSGGAPAALLPDSRTTDAPQPAFRREQSQPASVPRVGHGDARRFETSSRASVRSEPVTRPEPQQPPAEMSGNSYRPLSEIGTFWEEVKAQLPMKLKHGLLSGAVPSVNGTNVVKIACSPTYFSMAVDEDKQLIAKTLSELVGQPIEVELAKLDIVPHKAALPDAQGTANAGVSDKRDVQKMTPLVRKMAAEDDPRLRAALNLFDAKILETQ